MNVRKKNNTFRNCDFAKFQQKQERLSFMRRTSPHRGAVVSNHDAGTHRGAELPLRTSWHSGSLLISIGDDCSSYPKHAWFFLVLIVFINKVDNMQKVQNAGRSACSISSVKLSHGGRNLGNKIHFSPLSIIVYGGFGQWPPRSPNLTLMDFFQW